MLVQKVMADNKLDALVYPTKNIPAPCSPVLSNPRTSRSPKTPLAATIDGEEYVRTVERVTMHRAIDLAPEPQWRLPDHCGTGGITKRSMIVPPSKPRTGPRKRELVVQSHELPVSIDFLGRPFRSRS